jgi:serine/threonine-protein kinase
MSRLTSEQWRLFSDQLEQALQLPENERAAWLAALAGSEPQVAAEIERKLAVRDRPGFAAFLTDPLLAGGEDEGLRLVGREVGPYLIEDRIGEDGMGSIWRARRVDGRPQSAVVVKFVQARWRGEGRLPDRLGHPNIERLIDSGAFGQSQPYLVLEYVEGEPIDQYCERQRLDLVGRVRLFRDVLAAVGHAHSHLVVHRDLKPGNIRVTRDGVVKLLGFGVAQLLSEDAAAAATQTYALALTPQYAAPEQLLGKSITTATDVYALGLVLYQVLTGEPQVRIEGRSNAQLIQQIIHDPPRRASTARLVPGRRRRELRGDLDDILGKALRKEASQRYAGVGALDDDLRRYLAHEPVRAHAVTLPYRLRKFVRRHRGGALLGVLLALGLASTAGFAWMQMRSAPSSTPCPNSPRSPP